MQGLAHLALFIIAQMTLPFPREIEQQRLRRRRHARCPAAVEVARRRVTSTSMALSFRFTPSVHRAAPALVSIVKIDSSNFSIRSRSGRPRAQCVDVLPHSRSGSQTCRVGGLPIVAARVHVHAGNRGQVANSHFASTHTGAGSPAGSSG